MKRGMEPFLVPNRTISIKSVELPCLEGTFTVICIFVNTIVYECQCIIVYTVQSIKHLHIDIAYYLHGTLRNTMEFSWCHVQKYEQYPVKS